MYRRKVLITAAAAFAIGVAFAAQPSFVGADHQRRVARERDVAREREPWVPGTNMLMSAHDTTALPLAPPR